MAAYADRSLNHLLGDVAAERPAPGGGSCAAWVCALAAGLVEMAAAFAAGGPGQRGGVARVRALR